MMLIEQTTVSAAALPVAEFREHLRLGTGFADDGLQDSVLESCLRAAISAIEGKTGKALIERQFLQSVSAWRAPGWHPIHVAPVTSIVSLSVLDRAGSATLISDQNYGLQVDLSAPRLVAVGALPNIPTGGAAELVFVAGYGIDWTVLPEDLLRAVYLLAANFYENRHGGAFDNGQFPVAVDVLIDRYRNVRISGGGA